MNIDKAIEVLYHLKLHTYGAKERNAQDAIELGIEALKVVREFRSGKYKTINSPLPGETEE